MYVPAMERPVLTSPRPRPRSTARRRSALAAAGSLALLALTPGVASAVDSDIYHWDIPTGSVSQGCTEAGTCSFTRSQSGSAFRVQYRFTAPVSATTRVSSNVCSSFAFLGSWDFSAGDTNFRDIDGGSSSLPVAIGTCLVVRGRALVSAQYNRNGTIRR